MKVLYILVITSNLSILLDVILPSANIMVRSFVMIRVISVIIAILMINVQRYKSYLNKLDFQK